MSDTPETAPPSVEVLPPDAGASGVKEPEAELGFVDIVAPLIRGAKPEFFEQRAAGREYVAQWFRERLEETILRDFEDDTVYRRIAAELKRVHDEALPGLIENFVPDDLRANLACRIKPGNEHDDALNLISTAQALQGSGADRVSRFEAERDLALAYNFLLLVTDLEYGGARHLQAWNQTKKTRSDERRLVKFLRRAGVIVGPTAPSPLYVTLDEAAEFRCAGIEHDFSGARCVFAPPAAAEKPTLRILPKHEHVWLQTPQGLIPAFLIVRRKGVIQTIAKMLVSSMSDPRSVPDRRGIRFAYRSAEELKIGGDFVLRQLGYAGGLKKHVAAEDPIANPHAAKNLVLVKGQVHYRSQNIEVQHMLATQHVDLVLSTGPENATRYHRRMYTDPRGILMQLFPPIHYGVDWQSPELQAKMDDLVNANTLASFPK